MRLPALSILFLLTFLNIFSQERELGGIKFPGHIVADKEALFLNGAGIREKYFIDMYACALYLLRRSENASQIINANEKMALKMGIISSMVSNSLMQSAVRDGFSKSTNNNTAPIEKEIEQFIGAFSDPIKKGDTFDLNYFPGIGCIVYKNGVRKVQIAGLEFKKALFGIWLGPNPAHAELTKSLLSR